MNKILSLIIITLLFSYSFYVYNTSNNVVNLGDRPVLEITPNEEKFSCGVVDSNIVIRGEYNIKNIGKTKSQKTLVKVILYDVENFETLIKSTIMFSNNTEILPGDTLKAETDQTLIASRYTDLVKAIGDESYNIGIAVIVDYESEYEFIPLREKRYYKYNKEGLKEIKFQEYNI